MKSRKLLVALLVLVEAAPLAAEDKQKKKKKRGKRRAPSVVRVPKGIELSGEQKEKLAAIHKEFAPKAAELRKKQLTIVSKEQLKARRDATAAAKKAGKKGKELRAAVSAAFKLTAEQKSQASRGEQGNGRSPQRSDIQVCLDSDRRAKSQVA